MKRMLLLVDPQNDFINGSLAVPGATEKMDALANWISKNPDLYSVIVVSGDSHPSNHCSFANYGGQWPSHCVAGSQGAQIWPALLTALKKASGKFFILNKAEIEEEYSIFQNGKNSAFIEQLVRDDKIDKIDICGIAGDICVLSALKDAENLFGKDKIRILTQFSPSLDDGKALKKHISENGIEYC